jgi:hypothetical protein
VEEEKLCRVQTGGQMAAAMKRVGGRENVSSGVEHGGKEHTTYISRANTAFPE